MSKEQTPITAEEFYYKWQTQDFEHKKIEMPNFTEEELLNFGEQYAQYRERKAVLEALESLSDELWKSDLGTYEVRKVFDIIETEVKPKYNPEN